MNRVNDVIDGNNFVNRGLDGLDSLLNNATKRLDGLDDLVNNAAKKFDKVDDFINNAANKVDNADFSASLGKSWNGAKAKIDDVLSRVGHGGGEPPKRNGGSARGSADGNGSSGGAEGDEGGVNKYHAAALVGLGALGVAALAASSANTGPMSNDQLYSDPF